MRRYNYPVRRKKSSVSVVQQTNAYSVKEIVQKLVRDNEFLKTQAKMGTYDCVQTEEQSLDGVRPKADFDKPRAMSSVSRRALALRGIDAMYPPGVAEQIRKTSASAGGSSDPVPTPSPEPSPSPE